MGPCLSINSRPRQLVKAVEMPSKATNTLNTGKEI
jgi:hypothetical protein